MIFFRRPAVFLCAALFCCAAASVRAQEKRSVSLGLLLEANANTRHGYGLAGGLMGDYGITDRLAAGLKADAGSDFYDVSSLEFLAFGRYYFLQFKTPAPVFAQLGAGMITLFEEDRRVSSILADGSVGIRFPFNKFYAEPYLRFGWPHGFGFGLAAGYRFSPRKPPPPVEPEPVVEPEPYVEPEPPGPVIEEELEEEFGDDFVRRDDGSIVYMPAVFFRSYYADFGTHGLPEGIIENNIAILDNVAEFLKNHPDYTVEITGYANPVLGSPREEREKLAPLSLARAEFIKAELV
ncbi:MAG: hypothetical protein LBD09_00770, partial [Treponema sp.]|nr:hypothetical protein [Treponema sp.]